MRRFAGVTDETRRLSVQGEVARFVASVRVGAPPSLQREWRRRGHTERGETTRPCGAPRGHVRWTGCHRPWARLRRGDRPARRTRHVVVGPLAGGADEARRSAVQREVAQLMAPERIGVPPRDFRRHGSVTPQPDRQGGHRSTSAPATDAHASITTSDAVVQITTVHVGEELPTGQRARTRMRTVPRGDSQDGSDSR